MLDKESRILLVGGPDAGKTNYLTRLWLALRSGDGHLGLSVAPENIAYVEAAVAHLMSGQFAPHSKPDNDPLEFRARVIITKGAKSGSPAELLVPDTLGELWSRAVATREIESQWMDAIEASSAAALFVRIDSEQWREPLDWATSQRLLSSSAGEENDAEALPSQLFLCEMLKFLESRLDQTTGLRPRVAVIVTAWDLLDQERSIWTPHRYLQEEFPMFAGKIEDTSRVEMAVFGTSVVGGDLRSDATFRAQFLELDPSQLGYVVSAADGLPTRTSDLTLPISWLLRAE